MDRSSPVWRELEQIDYFLEHLARAVERGEVHRASYDLLAPRYLERRSELASVIKRAAVASAPAPAPARVAAPAPAAAPLPAPVARPPRQVPWTTVLTITGAFLVIVASAIFAVATWDVFGAGFRLAFLGALTAAFYAVGWFVRSRMGLTSGGLALTAVGSAMLLFDGWIAIDGYALRGAWPWVGWLLFCSAAYWITEVAVGGRFFGVTGAAAQIAWVWLLGDALHWPTPARMAGIAVVACAWSLSARFASDRAAFAPLAATLRWGAPVAVALSSAGLLSDLMIAPADLLYLVSALVCGAAVTLVVDVTGLPRGPAAVGYAPFLLAVAGLAGEGREAWIHLALLAALVVGAVVYEVLRGGFGHGLLALVGKVGAILLLGELVGWHVSSSIALVAVAAATWSVAWRYVPGTDPGSRDGVGQAAEGPGSLPGAPTLRTTLRTAAPIVAVPVLLASSAAAGEASGWPGILAALVVGAALTVVVEATPGTPRVVAAFGYVPLALALASVVTSGAFGLAHALLLFAITVLFAVYEVYRGGWGLGTLAVLAEASAWLVLGAHLEWAADVMSAVLAVVAASWVAGSWLLARTEEPPPYPGLGNLLAITDIGGWGLLAIVTLSMPFVSRVVPLAGFAVEARDAGLAGLITIVWGTLAALRRAPFASAVSFVVSLWAVAAAMAWSAPNLHSALYATGLVLAAGVWLIARHAVERVSGLDARAIAWAVRAVLALAVPLGIAAPTFSFDPASWECALLFAVAALVWLLDAFVTGETPASFGSVSAHLVLAAGTLAWWITDAVSSAAVVAAAAAVLLAGAAPLLGGDRSRRAAWAGASAVAATVLALGAAGENGPLAGAAALAALAWLLLAWSVRIAEVAVFGGLLGFLALIPLSAHLAGGGWLTVALFVVPAFLALLPVMFADRQAPWRRWAVASAYSGAVGLVVLLVLALASRGSIGLAPGAALSPWFDLGGHGLAAALLALGGYVVAASQSLTWRAGPYLGVALVLLAYVVELGELGVGTTEWISTPVAVYVAWAGARYARGSRHRVPVVVDVATALIGLGPATLLAAIQLAAGDPWVHLVWAVALALVSIALGVVLRVRAYFFGGVAAIVFTALVRTWVYLVSFWWVVLGVIGVSMLVVALTWERQQMLVASARRNIHEALSDWR